MDRYPVSARVRRRWEQVIRIIDIVIYAAVFAGGVYALVGTPNSVVDELRGWEWVIGLWAGLLLTGGAVGFAGRLSRRWMVEVPATVLSFFGALIYLVVLGRYTLASITSAVAVTLVLVATLEMLRRYAELQIFSSEPHTDFRARMAAAITRRTADFPHRHR